MTYQKKEDIVLYNPKKGKEFTEKIIRQSPPDINWVPLINLTTNQVHELIKKSKVYIDFGSHPGKDRFPREAASLGCCVITGKRGAAKYHQDVPINDKYKFDDKTKNIPDIIEQIKFCLANYSSEVNNFSDYRSFIKNEKRIFSEDVKKIFRQE